MMIRQIKAPFFKTIRHKGMLATVISCSLNSGRMRYAPTVGGEKQNINDTPPSHKTATPDGMAVNKQHFMRKRSYSLFISAPGTGVRVQYPWEVIWATNSPEALRISTT